MNFKGSKKADESGYKAFARYSVRLKRGSRSRGEGGELAGNIINRGQRAGHMDFFAGFVHVDQQSAVMRADTNVLSAVVNLNQFGFGIFSKFLRHGVHQRHKLPS